MNRLHKRHLTFQPLIGEKGICTYIKIVVSIEKYQIKVSIKNFSGAEETAQSGRNLPHKHENLSSILRTWGQVLGIRARACYPALGGGVNRIPGVCWPARLTLLANAGHCLKGGRWCF